VVGLFQMLVRFFKRRDRKRSANQISERKLKRKRIDQYRKAVLEKANADFKNQIWIGKAHRGEPSQTMPGTLEETSLL